MRNLKLKNSVLILISILFLGCATANKNTSSSFFIVKQELGGVSEVIVTPDRILLECVDTEENPDEGGRYLFMIQMLDEENTVTTSMLGIRPDKTGCEKILKKSNRILKKAKRVYIGNHNSITDEPRVEDRTSPYTFPGHGKFYSNGRVLQLGVITNDKGACYNPTVRDNKPCLEYPFPIDKYEKQLSRIK
jgi:hypothetical protein